MGLCKPPHRARLWGATTTYGYDAFGSRVFQTTATSTTIYPFKWYSVASSTGSGATYATTTEYVFNGDTLVSTLDQQFANGAATGTAQTSYVHADHLGSTNVVTNASGTVVQTLDYYPYGSPRIKSGTDVSQREYIGQYFDEGSNLNYLNARYYDPARGHFLSQDPVFWSFSSDLLKDPQQLNAYGYARDNPITVADPSGKLAEWGGRYLPFTGIGTHEYVYFRPERPDLVNYSALGIPARTQEFTIGFYNPGSGYLESGVYYPGQQNAPAGAQADFSGHAIRRYEGRTAEINGLSPEDEAGAINNMAQAVNSYDNRTVKYPSVKQTVAGTGVNSNSGIHTLAAISGLNSSFQSFNPLGYSSGANLFLPSQSFGSSAVQRQVQITSLQLQVAQLQLQIIQLQTSNAQSTKQILR